MNGGCVVRLRVACRRLFASDAARCVFAVGLIVACVTLAHVFGVVLCPMKRILGVPCPTCGLTRAFVSLLHGNVGEAFAIQPLAMTLACLSPPTLLVSWAWFGPIRTKGWLAMVVQSRLFWCLFAMALAANWTYVILRGN